MRLLSKQLVVRDDGRLGRWSGLGDLFFVGHWKSCFAPLSSEEKNNKKK